MWKRLWAFLSGDSVSAQADLYSTTDSLQRFIYKPELIAQINEGRRYQILTNRAQTQIYVLDTLHRQKVGRFYDISYALIIADALNEDSGNE